MFSTVFVDYYGYRKECYEHSDIAVYGHIFKGLPWSTKNKSDAQWVVKSFPGVPFVRYEGSGSKLYDIKDAGRVMGQAHDYEERAVDPTIKPVYILKRERGTVNGNPRIRHYRSVVADLETNDEIIVNNVFAFTWWTIGGEAYGASNKKICFDQNAVEKIQKAFRSKE